MSLERQLPDLTSDSKCEYNGNELSIVVGLEYSGTVLFNSSSVSLQHGVIYGLVGPNGTGKSSFFDVLRSRILPGFPDDLTITLVRSDQRFDAENGDLPAKEFLGKSLDQYHEALSARIEHLEQLLENTNEEEKILALTNTLCRTYETLESASVEEGKKDIENTLDTLGFRNFGVEEVNVSKLSGGWRMKCQLAKAATSLSDILLVDEPSFLDEAATKWLFKFLKKAASKGSIIVITSHKENVLAEVCDRVLHITPSKQLKQFNGSFDSFLTANSQQEASLCALEEKFMKKEQAHTNAVNKMKKKIEKGEKGLRASIVKNGSDQRFIKGRSKEKKQRAGKSISVKAKLLSKEKDDLSNLQNQRNDPKTQKLSINGEELRLTAGGIVIFNGVTFGYAHSTPLFENLDLTLSPSDRIALVGANGTGKSTLVKLMLGEIQPTYGSITQTARPRVAYFPQSAAEGLKLDFGNLNSIEYLSHFASSGFSSLTARQHLGGFGLKKKVPLRKIRELSTGQRTRLYLAKEFLVNPNPNILILDEVSDNLDVETVKQLKESLDDFPGAIVAISHQHEDFLLGFCTQTWKIKNKRVLVSSSKINGELSF